MPHSDSHKNDSPQHRGQVLWTGAVALLLAIVGLEQAADPVSSANAMRAANDIPSSVLSPLASPQTALSFNGLNTNAPLPPANTRDFVEPLLDGQRDPAQEPDIRENVVRGRKKPAALPQ